MEENQKSSIDEDDFPDMKVKLDEDSLKMEEFDDDYESRHLGEGWYLKPHFDNCHGPDGQVFTCDFVGVNPTLGAASFGSPAKAFSNRFLDDGVITTLCRHTSERTEAFF